MILRSPIGNIVLLQHSETGKFKIYIRHGWEQVLPGESFRKLGVTMQQASRAIEVFGGSVKRAAEILRNVEAENE